MRYKYNDSERSFPDESYVYFTCVKCGSLFSDTHYFADMENYICDECSLAEE